MFRVQEIAEIIDRCLYAVVWEGEETDSFDQMISLTEDPMAIENYLRNNKTYFDLGYYHYSMEEAADRIIDEYEELVEEIITRAQEGPYEEKYSLQRLFLPLDDRKGLLDYTKAKAKSSTYKPIIRIYGYKLDTNCIIISGYAIKLTLRMDHPDLKRELDKLNVLEKYLNEADLPICI